MTPPYDVVDLSNLADYCGLANTLVLGARLGQHVRTQSTHLTAFKTGRNIVAAGSAAGLRETGGGGSTSGGSGVNLDNDDGQSALDRYFIESFGVDVDAFADVTGLKLLSSEFSNACVCAFVCECMCACARARLCACVCV